MARTRATLLKTTKNALATPQKTKPQAAAQGSVGATARAGKKLRIGTSTFFIAHRTPQDFQMSMFNDPAKLHTLYISLDKRVEALTHQQSALKVHSFSGEAYELSSKAKEAALRITREERAAVKRRLGQLGVEA